MPDPLKRPKTAPHFIPQWAWDALKLPARFLPHRKPAWFWAWRKWRLAKPKPKPPVPPKPVKVYMYDDVTVSLIPRTAKYVAGYIDGHWITWLKLKLRCPLAKRMSIAVFPSDNADCLDVEKGDALNEQAPAWVKRQLARRKVGVKYNTPLPVLYTAASNGEALIAICTKAGLRYGIDYLWLSAHYSPVLGEHVCNPKCYPGLKHTAHGTQFTDHALNESLDESVIPDVSKFFGPATTAA